MTYDFTFEEKSKMKNVRISERNVIYGISSICAIANVAATKLSFLFSFSARVSKWMEKKKKKKYNNI